jgi:hypothetical protein
LQKLKKPHQSLVRTILRQLTLNSEFTRLYTLNDSQLYMRWAGQVARMGDRRGVCRVLVGKPEGKRPLGRPRRRCEDIKIGLQEVGCGGTNWIELAKDWDS